MMAGQRQSVMTTSAALTQPARSERLVLPAVVLGLAVVAGISDGAFWAPSATLVAVTSGAVLVVALIAAPPDRRGTVVVACLMLLALWWFFRAVTAGSGTDFLPLGASILGFAAAFAVVYTLSSRVKEIAVLAVACLGAAGALAGFVGLVCRWYPMAIPAQGLWRLSSTLTYSDAAGLVLGVCLLVALGSDLHPVLVRLAVCLTAAGLLATQSRGAYVAVACGCLLVPWRRYVKFCGPLAVGAGLGIAAIASSPDRAAVPWLGVVLIGALVIAVLDPPDRLRSWFRARTPWFVATVVGGLLVTAVLLHHEIGLRALAPSDGDRSVEWSAALHQWASAPIVGVGPDRLLTFRVPDGTIAHFAHNEYLQVGADAGAVGISLLGLVAFSLTRVVRRLGVLSSCAAGALVSWAVGGAFDFDWHLPFVGLLGGCCAGLAAGWKERP
jgi:hypothetical protein